MSLRILDFDSTTAPEEFLYKLMDFFEKQHKEKYPKDPLPTREVWLKRLRVKQKPGTVYVQKAVLSDVNDEIVARLKLQIFNEQSEKFVTNKHMVIVDFDFLKEFENMEIIDELFLSSLVDLEKYEYVTTFEVITEYPRVWKFLEKYGLNLIQEEAEMRAYIDEIDWQLKTEWIKEGRLRAQKENIELISFEVCPEEIIEEFAACITAVLKLLPLGESGWTPHTVTPKSIRLEEEKTREHGFRYFCFVTKEKNGILSGMTEIYHSPDTPHWVSQDLTGVLETHRNRGIGKWLKAEMSYYIKENLPNALFIKTQNADHNAAMLSINNRMGFKKQHPKRGFKIDIDILKRNLS